jgi:hypothetical protein
VKTLQSHPEGLPPLWVAVGVILVVGVFAAVMIQVSYLRNKRRMDELWAAAHEADRQWRLAMIEYLSRPPAVKPKAQPEAITVEMEVIKPERVRGEWRDGE